MADTARDIARTSPARICATQFSIAVMEIGAKTESLIEWFRP
jgi:hypothetical protein